MPSYSHYIVKQGHCLHLKLNLLRASYFSQITTHVNHIKTFYYNIVIVNLDKDNTVTHAIHSVHLITDTQHKSDFASS